MSAGLADRVCALLGEPVGACRAIGGGCIGESHALQLGGGERLFVKDYRGGPRGMPSAEAAGLAWLAEADALPVARVRTHSDDAGLLVLEWIETGPPAADFAETLGRGLAALHRCGAPRFGFGRDNFIGSLPQANAALDDWPSFYGTRRLAPLLARACDAGLLDGARRRRSERLIARLPELCGPPEPPARLHGDLWRGNLMTDAGGAPVLIDPAVYAGHREIDLAMMRLFGGFPRRAFDAYAEAWPLAEGAAERVALYQLHPLLVHVVLFGGHYVGSYCEAVEAYL